MKLSIHADQLARACLGMTEQQIMSTNKALAGVAVVQQRFTLDHKEHAQAWQRNAQAWQRHYNDDGTYMNTEWITVLSV